jgi:hypothetical protein
LFKNEIFVPILLTSESFSSSSSELSSSSKSLFLRFYKDEKIRVIGLNDENTFEAESRWWPRAGATLAETRFGVFWLASADNISWESSSSRSRLICERAFTF